MSKNPARTPSVSERRKQEELRRQKAKQRNLIIGGVLVALMAVVALAIFLTRDDPGEPAAGGTEMTGERPLAAIDPAERADYFTEPPPTIIGVTVTLPRERPSRRATSSRTPNCPWVLV